MRRLGLACTLLLIAPAAAAAAPVTTSAPGAVTTTFRPGGPATEYIAGLVPLPDGGTVAAATVHRAEHLALVRYTSTGAPDPAFGAGGAVVVDGLSKVGAMDLLRQPDGRLTAVAYRPQGGPVTVVRTDAAGHLDPAFGGDGKADLPALWGGGSGSVVGDDGSVTVAGWTGRTPQRQRIAVARLDPSGAPDAGFGSGGLSRPLASVGSASAAAVGPDGRVLVVGQRGNPVTAVPKGVLVALTPAGALDTSFGGGDGVVSLSDLSFTLVVDAAGRISVAGYEDGATVTRFNADGTRDASFGTNGRVKIGKTEWISALLPAGDGLDVIAGQFWEPRLVHLDAGGARTLSRVMALPFGGLFVASDVVRRAGGGLLLGGFAAVTDGADGDAGDVVELAVAATTATGELDTSFGAAQPLTVSIGDRLTPFRVRGWTNATVGLGRRGVAQVRVSRGGVTLARGRVNVTSTRPATGPLRLTRAGRRAVRGGRSVRVRVRVRAVDLAGNTAERTENATFAG